METTNVQDWLNDPAEYQFEPGMVACLEDMLAFMGLEPHQVEGIGEEDEGFVMPLGFGDGTPHTFTSDGWVHHTYAIDGGWVGFFEDQHTSAYIYVYRRVA